MWVAEGGRSWVLKGGERLQADKRKEKVHGRGISVGPGMEQDWGRMENLGGTRSGYGGSRPYQGEDGWR